MIGQNFFILKQVWVCSMILIGCECIHRRLIGPWMCGGETRTRGRKKMKLLLLCVTNALLCLASGHGNSDSLEKLKADLQKILEERSKTWNCSFSVAIKTPAIPGAPLTVVAGGEEKG